MKATTRQQLLSLSTEFYRAHAAGFDASRGHQPWPGWERLLEWLPAPNATTTTGVALSGAEATPLSVLDVGCGNARLATFLSGAGYRLRYVGVDANSGLLSAARERLAPDLASQVELIENDFLAIPPPGAGLPSGPFDLVALFGVLHHVPGRDWRFALLRALAERLAEGGVLALAAWQFAGRSRFERRKVAWEDVGPILGEPLDLSDLEDGDTLLRFGPDPSMPPRYCHQVADAEFDSICAELAGSGVFMEIVGDFRADGSEGDLNRYAVLRRRSQPAGI